MTWTFLDFVDAEGVNEIKAWVEGLPASVRKRVKAKFNQRLLMLSALPLLNDARYTKMLGGECDGLMEIRFEADNVQYRPLAAYGPERHEITILYGAEERGDKFIPRDACNQALRRKALIDAQARKHVVSHDFNQTTDN